VRAGLKGFPRILRNKIQIEAVIQPLDKGADEDFDSAVLVEGAFKSEGKAHEVRAMSPW
jgi:hypothetical protein